MCNSYVNNDRWLNCVFGSLRLLFDLIRNVNKATESRLDIPVVLRGLLQNLTLNILSNHFCYSVVITSANLLIDAFRHILH